MHQTPVSLRSAAFALETHHALGHVNELLACQLYPLGVPLYAHEAAAVRVLWDPHRYLVLLLYPVNCRVGTTQT